MTTEEIVVNVNYEIRTKRGAKVFIYDDLAAAKREIDKHQRRIGCDVCIVKVTQIEEVLQ